jgi:hypothetical protein
LLVPATAALVAAASLGIWFSATRSIALCAFAALCFLFPWLALIVVGGVAWAFIRKFKKF